MADFVHKLTMLYERDRAVGVISWEDDASSKNNYKNNTMDIMTCDMKEDITFDMTCA